MSNSAHHRSARAGRLNHHPHTIITPGPAEHRTTRGDLPEQPRADESQPAGAQPRRFDPGVPNPARIYSLWTGGKDHFPADRDAADQVAACRPQVAASARANRAFLGRVVRHLAGPCGIRQFVDIGPGLPAPGATHAVAQAIAPQSKIVYVDNDPLVLVHAQALLTSGPGGWCEYVHADLRDPDTIMKQAAQALDLTRPAAVILAAVLHFVPDADDPAGIVATLAAALASGSFVAISHLTSDFAPEAVTAGVAAYNALVPAQITARSHAQVTALFGGLSLTPPGVVPVSEWRPDHAPVRGVSADVYAALATITRRSRWPPPGPAGGGGQPPPARPQQASPPPVTTGGAGRRRHGCAASTPHGDHLARPCRGAAPTGGCPAPAATPP